MFILQLLTFHLSVYFEVVSSSSVNSETTPTTVKKANIANAIKPNNNIKRDPGSPENFYDSENDFMILSEFGYGQRALYGEPCDLEAFNRIVKPIYLTAIYQDKDPSVRKSWANMQQQYVATLEKNRLHSLRSKTCHADHLMQCSSTTDSHGRHVCECLNIPPVYNQVLDKATQQCRATQRSRCYSPFGFYCLTGLACRAEPSGKCFCKQNVYYSGGGDVKSG
ncbi:unnamed protein product [Allacma fusca]|uniref:Uncharacterized protein n=1 Tax=Allacma fusca TaxID=39272 RepID=A0A8J2K544_9HEXA|nr:unnamed protein product [Allacma fusca]